MRKRTGGNAKEKEGKGKMKGKFRSTGRSKCRRGKKGNKSWLNPRRRKIPFLEGNIIRIFVTKNLHVDAFSASRMFSSLRQEICFYLLRRLYKSVFLVQHLPNLLEVFCVYLKSFLRFSPLRPSTIPGGNLPRIDSLPVGWRDAGFEPGP
jgi:hypothetical protein